MSARTVRPLPAMDRDSRPWWEALARHELTLQRCDRCSAWRWPARAICNRCSSFESTWTPVSGRGDVVSWVVNRHAFTADFESPYAVLTVRLAEQRDVAMLGSYVGALDALRIGLPVEAVFDDVVDADGTTFTLLSWRAADSG